MTDEPTHITAWKKQTTAFDRVQSVAQAVSQPRSASWIASEAAVAENTARDHLERLVEMNVLLETSRDGTAMYVPDPLYTRAQTLREYLDEYEHDGLIELKEDIQTQLETLRSEYGVESPQELREQAADSDAVEKIREYRKTASDWELAQYRLSIVDEAIRNYTTYNRHNTASAY